MRTIAFGLVAAALLALGAASTPASAMPANGLTAAWDATASVQDVHWRGHGWGWRQHHHWGGRHHGWRRW